MAWEGEGVKSVGVGGGELTKKILKIKCLLLQHGDRLTLCGRQNNFKQAILTTTHKLCTEKQRASFVDWLILNRNELNDETRRFFQINKHVQPPAASTSRQREPDFYVKTGQSGTASKR